MNDTTSDRGRERHPDDGNRGTTARDQVDGAQVAAAFARRATMLTVPPPELEHLRQLARHRPRAGGAPRPLVTRGLAAAAVITVLATSAYAVVTGRADRVEALPGGPSAASAAAQPPISDAELAGGAPVVLRRIAAVTQTSPITVPRPDQFVYTKLVGTGTPKGGPADSPGPPQPVSSEVWIAQADGTDSLAVYGDGTRVPISHESEGDPGTDVETATYADLTRIPTDPAGLRAYLDEQFPGQPLQGAELLLQGNLVPPSLASAIFRVLADEPGLTVDSAVSDAAGRPGVGVGQTDGDGVLHELLFDRDRLNLIGTRQVRTRGTAANAPEQVIGSVAFVEQAIVDDAGERPS